MLLARSPQWWTNGNDFCEIRVGVPEAMARGRQTLRARLTDWGCVNEDAVLVFSELVTNAIVHTAGGSRTVITHGAGAVRLDAHDGSHAISELRNDQRPGGFGLRIVTELSESWGWEQTATGKVVWAFVPCAS